MCIILSCDPGYRPSLDMVRTCFDNNPDGAGYMYATRGEVVGRKGYTDPDMLLDQAIRDAPPASPLVFHFRIGTSGGYGLDVTHPYPITRDLRKLHALEWHAPFGIAHNGVLPYKADDARHISDTIAFIKSDCFTIKKDPRTVAQGGLTRSKSAKTFLAGKTRGSRICIMDGAGRVRLIGDGWTQAAPGIMASNESYIERAVKWSAPSLFDVADDTFYDDYGLPTSCRWCALKKACEVQCPFCDDVAYELGYTPMDVDAVNAAVWGEAYSG